MAKPLAVDQVQLRRWAVVWIAACTLLIMLQFRSHSSPLFPVSQQPSTHLVVGNVSTVTWFPNTSANQHVTPDLGSLTDSAPYLGNDYLHVGGGKGLDISHLGHTTLHSPKRMFTLSNVLHVPHITKPLLSVQKFCRETHLA